jgi:hypothetical protein
MKKSLDAADRRKALGRNIEPLSNFSQALVSYGILIAWKTEEQS